MGFLKGPVTFQRFRVAGVKPRLFGEDHLARLRNLRAGQKLTPLNGVSIGWAAGSSILDTEFTELKNVYPDHLVWDFWVEVNKAPPELYKAYYATDLAALAKNNPSGKPSAKNRREARESAADRLREQARDGRFLKRTCIPVIWDAIQNVVYFGSASANQAERFLRLFQETFENNLFQPTQLAGKLSVVDAHSLATAIDANAKGVTLTSLVNGIRFPDSPVWCPSEEDVRFLGNEWLVWLWHRADVETDELTTPDGEHVTYMFSGGIRLECPAGDHGNVTVNHASAIRTPSARAALRSGKLPRKTALTLVRNNEQYSFKIAAETFSVNAAKLPTPDAAVTGRELEVHRLEATRDLASIIDQVFAAFMTVRMDESRWKQEVEQIRDWSKRLDPKKARS